MMYMLNPAKSAKGTILVIARAITKHVHATVA